MADRVNMVVPAIAPKFDLRANLARIPLFAWLFLVVALPNILLLAVSFFKH
jgi:hypothetical protein